MLKKIISTLLILITINVYSQQKPKIVVGIVVDQMRYDFIDRFWNDFSKNGFKKLVNTGHFCRNTNFGYMPTFTGPGHASIFTGTTPSTHGIIANNWFDKESEKLIYCAGSFLRNVHRRRLSLIETLFYFQIPNEFLRNFSFFSRKIQTLDFSFSSINWRTVFQISLSLL